MDKHGVIGGTEYNTKLDYLPLTKKVLLLMLYHDQTFLSQSIPYPLTNNISKSGTSSQDKENLHRTPQPYLHYR